MRYLIFWRTSNLLYYNLHLGEEELLELAKSPSTIFNNLEKKIPVNLDKRIFNNTVFYYYSCISSLPGLTVDLVKQIRLDYMRNHQGAIYGDMTEFISIPEFKGGKRVEIRISDITTPRTIKSSRCTGI